jgi:phosphate uptake regulator
MHIDQHRERLRERIALLAALVEGAYVATIASASEPPALPSGRVALLHDDIVGLSQEVQAEATQFLVRFRPVASDLHFATVALGCCADLQVAAVAAARADEMGGEIAWALAKSAVPSLDRLASCVYVVVSLMVDAVNAWDPSAVDAVGEVRNEVVVIREKVRAEVADAVVREGTDADVVMRIDAIACLLERIAAVSASCTRRLARIGPAAQITEAMRA